jgi:hypothetical protein
MHARCARETQRGGGCFTDACRRCAGKYSNATGAEACFDCGAGERCMLLARHIMRCCQLPANALALPLYILVVLLRQNIHTLRSSVCILYSFAATQPRAPTFSPLVPLYICTNTIYICIYMYIFLFFTPSVLLLYYYVCIIVYDLYVHRYIYLYIYICFSLAALLLCICMYVCIYVLRLYLCIYICI